MLLRRAIAFASRPNLATRLAAAISTRIARPKVGNLQHDARGRAMMFYSNITCDDDLPAFVSGESKKISRNMARRLSDAFNFASGRFGGHGELFWAKNDMRNADLITALRTGQLDTISDMMNNPAEHSLFWGIDGLTKGFTPERSHPPSALASHSLLVVDGLLRLAEAVGAKPVWYPEAHLERSDKISVEKTLDAIERTIGTPIDFPNPFPNEFGIRTSRGVASYRTFQSIYQAWRLLRLAEVSGRRIVEIGPGLGRTAYYARKFGLSNYSTVDLPLGNIAQACFLSRALGEDAIALPGEQAQAGQIKIETPSWYLASNETFDIAFNADSLTEMALDNANAYAKKIVATSRLFVTINHEINAFRVSDLLAPKGLSGQRFPYWMRKGYVEEIYFIGIEL